MAEEHKKIVPELDYNLMNTGPRFNHLVEGGRKRSLFWEMSKPPINILSKPSLNSVNSTSPLFQKKLLQLRSNVTLASRLIIPNTVKRQVEHTGKHL